METQDQMLMAYEQRSQETLDMALATAPAYQPWKPLDPGPTVPADDRYAALPALTKREMRENFPQGLVPNYRNVAVGLANGEIELVHTSGTTEERVTNIWHQSWWDASERASWQLNAHTAFLNGSQPEAQLASSLSVGMRSNQDLPMAERRLGRFLFLNEKISVLDWTDQTYERIARELEEYRPEVLEANPSMLARLAWWALDHRRVLYQPRVILLTYELPSALNLRDIARVFNAPVVSSYGSTEVGYVYMQCEHGNFHQNREFCRVDFQPLKPEHGGPALGRILVTTFQNPWASLVRFDVGDLVRLDQAPACACGRQSGRLIAAIEGRLANATFNTRGELVSTKATDDQLARLPEIRDYQLVQRSNRDYALTLVLTDGSASVRDRAQRLMLELYGGDARFELSVSREIAPGPSGKYRRTQAEFTFDMKGLLA